MLKLKINLEDMIWDEDQLTTSAIKEFDEHLKKNGVNFTRRGKNVTYVGTEKQLLEAAFQEYQFWFADGPSFSEEEALEFIRERAV